MKVKIALLPGDGIGPEVVRSAVWVLKEIEKKFGHFFEFKKGLIGAAAIEKTGSPLPAQTLKICQESDAILFGAVGHPRYNDPTLKPRPEEGLLTLRKKLGLYANLRPIKVLPSLLNLSTLKPKVLKGVDLVILRELGGGIYFGTPRERKNGGKIAIDTCVYSKEEVRRIAHLAFKIAQKRRRKVTNVDKSNVLETSRLWREVVLEVAKNYPQVELEHLYVDVASLMLVKKPTNFDIILTTNMFGDILSDEAAILCGSLGMIPSASFSSKKIHLYEPIHGSAPKYTGKNKVNPVATILSAALMLRYSFGLEKEAQAIEKGIEKTLKEGFRTYDIMEEGCFLASTDALTEKIIENIIKAS